AKDSAATIAVGTIIHAFLRSSAAQTSRRSRSPNGPPGSATGAGSGFGAGAGLAAGAAAACTGASVAFSDCQNFRRIARSSPTQPATDYEGDYSRLWL